MNTVTVHASKCYDISIGSGLMATVGMEAKRLGKVSKVCIISDSNVYPLYGAQVEASLSQAGLTVTSFVFPAGEAQKNGQTWLSLLNHMAEHHMSRSDLIVALGGGVVGDLAGFAAATYLRGIRLLQMPTTLLAAVDSSVGGKTAIDLAAGKNLAGVFYQPDRVLCDTDTLETLPEAVFRDGCAEIIKYGILYDEPLLTRLEQTGLAFPREEVIARCIAHKRDVVMADEYDSGQRMKLNLGHTIGHGVEASSQFSVTHGQAVAIGIAVISRSASARGHLAEADCQRILSLLSRFGLPITTAYSARQLAHYALSDKKRSGTVVSLIEPRGIGNCQIVPTPTEKLQSILQAGL